jgi:acyl-coenzyme A thioesterase PaaI-like protein
MRKIKNPFTSVKDYCCFGCSPDNHNGLQMDFFEDGDEIICEWEPSHHLQGYPNVLHGGIQSALMDEIAYWVVLIKLKTAAVTSKLEVKLKKSVYMNKGNLFLRAKLVEVIHGKIAHVSVNLSDSENKICATGNIHYFLFSLEESIKNYNYPKDYSSFFEN